MHNKSFEFIVLNGLMQKQESQGVWLLSVKRSGIFFDLLGIDFIETNSSLRMSARI